LIAVGMGSVDHWRQKLLRAERPVCGMDAAIERVISGLHPPMHDVLLKTVPMVGVSLA
jgi:hypothetical protein